MPTRSVRTVRRLPTRRRIKPMRQGDLDGLCGVYAIINAIRWLCPSMSEAQSEKLFKALVQARQEQVLKQPLAFVYRGLNRSALNRLLDVATSWVEINLGVSVEGEWLASAYRKGPPLATVWRRLKASIAADSVIIVGLSGHAHHWTVVVAATRRQLRLFDSGGMVTLRRDRCLPRRDGERHYRVELKSVMVVRRHRRPPLTVGEVLGV